jgi:hypothetical protein
MQLLEQKSLIFICMMSIAASASVGLRPASSGKSTFRVVEFNQNATVRKRVRVCARSRLETSVAVPFIVGAASAACP